MELFDPTQNLLQGAMLGAAARQSALSSNLANANTAGYKRVDVDFHSVLAQAAQQGGNVDPSSLSFTQQVDPAAMQVDGNGVDIDTESADLASNGLEYQALASVAEGRIGILKAAMGAG